MTSKFNNRESGERGQVPWAMVRVIFAVKDNHGDVISSLRKKEFQT